MQIIQKDPKSILPSRPPKTEQEYSLSFLTIKEQTRNHCRAATRMLGGSSCFVTLCLLKLTAPFKCRFGLEVANWIKERVIQLDEEYCKSPD